MSNPADCTIGGSVQVKQIYNMVKYESLSVYQIKVNQTVLELDFRAVKFLFFPRRDLNPHHCYTAAPFA
jgi:hypothetical protein